MPSEPPSQMIRVPTPLVESFRELSRLHRAGRTKAVLEGIERLVAAIDSETEIDIDSVTTLISTLTSRLERLESLRESEEAAIDIASLMLSISDLTERLVHVESDIEAIALTLQDLNVRMSDLEGMGDIGYTTSRLSELEALDDIEYDIDLTAETLATDDIATDSTTIAEAADQDDITANSSSTAEAESRSQPQTPLTLSALAMRLGISDKTIQKHRLHGEESFASWSRARDPDGIPWTWEGTNRRGQPLRFVPSDAKAE